MYGLRRVQFSCALRQESRCLLRSKFDTSVNSLLQTGQCITILRFNAFTIGTHSSDFRLPSLELCTFSFGLRAAPEASSIRMGALRLVGGGALAKLSVSFICVSLCFEELATEETILTSFTSSCIEVGHSLSTMSTPEVVVVCGSCFNSFVVTVFGLKKLRRVTGGVKAFVRAFLSTGGSGSTVRSLAAVGREVGRRTGWTCRYRGSRNTH